jgi:DNA-binding SARP family transcriptional activator
MANQNDPSVQGLAKSRSKWQLACDLLNSGQYEPVARLLHGLQATSEQVDDGFLDDLLVAAYQICLACHQCTAEKEWHVRASEELRRREDELKQVLGRILEVIPRYATLQPDSDFPGGPETALSQAIDRLSDVGEHHNLWQRILNVIGWGITTPAVEQPKAEIEVSLPDRDLQIGMTSAIQTNVQTTASSARLSVYCLGSFRIYNNDRLIEKWPGQKCKSIFKYMIINRERSIHQEILMDLFWADVAPEAARRNLYQAIYSLRQVLQTDQADIPYVLCENSCYGLSPELGLWIDSEAFLGQYQTGQKLEHQGRQAEAVAAYESAESLYGGEFLVEDLYEDWLLVHRENLKHAYLDILERLSRYYFEQQQWAMCIAFCQKILTRDNCREDAHRRLIRCYMHQGQRHLALRQYHLCVEALARELDVPPMPATLKLYQKIRQDQAQNSSSPKLKHP